VGQARALHDQRAFGAQRQDRIRRQQSAAFKRFAIDHVSKDSADGITFQGEDHSTASFTACAGWPSSNSSSVYCVPHSGQRVPCNPVRLYSHLGQTIASLLVVLSRAARSRGVSRQMIVTAISHTSGAVTHPTNSPTMLSIG